MIWRHRGGYRRPETKVLVDITRYSSETDILNNGITDPWDRVFFISEKTGVDKSASATERLLLLKGRTIFEMFKRLDGTFRSMYFFTINIK